MQCPVCNESLEAITHEGIEIESCHKCNGAWFDKNELSSYLKKRSERFNRSRTQKNIIVKKNSDFVIQSSGFCPKCN
ncbi:hypothetical protein EP227_06205 [bacterium]|nr:MAG: hypothetical protein EP227_06205 [bacterium]